MSSERVLLHTGGEIYDPWEWMPEFWSPSEAEEYSKLLEAGELIREDGTRLDPQADRRTRALILGRKILMEPGLNHLSGPEGRRCLVEPFWLWGTYPMLGGTYKAGKTTLVADLVASLLVKDRLFLGKYRTMLTEEELNEGVVVINAETPKEDFENALLAAGVDPNDDRLTIWHLDELGGPSLLDVTVPENFDAWEVLLAECNECDDGLFWTPSVVIVDGLTAIVGDPTRYGEWYPQFKRLMKATDVPNALVTGHTAAGTSHLYEATRSMAGPDGVWSYTSERADDPTSARHFQVLPRVGGAPVPRTRVRRGEGGLLHVSVGKSSSEDEPRRMSAPDEERQHNEPETHVLAKLAEGEAFTTQITGKGRVGQERRQALLALKRSGRVTSRAAVNGRGEVWSLVDSA